MVITRLHLMQFSTFHAENLLPVFQFVTYYHSLESFINLVEMFCFVLCICMSIVDFSIILLEMESAC